MGGDRSDVLHDRQACGLRPLGRDDAGPSGQLALSAHAINIDAELVVGVESDVVSLANGCVCCSIRDDLREVASRLPGGVYRAKGIVYASDAPGRRAVLQVVGKRVDIALAEEWGLDEPRTRIVAIGRPDVDAQVLQDAFERCY